MSCILFKNALLTMHYKLKIQNFKKTHSYFWKSILENKRKVNKYIYIYTKKSLYNSQIDYIKNSLMKFIPFIFDKQKLKKINNKFFSFYLTK